MNVSVEHLGQRVAAAVVVEREAAEVALGAGELAHRAVPRAIGAVRQSSGTWRKPQRL